MLFAGPTAARKGAHELREAARKLDLEVHLGGSNLEGEGFWRGVRTRSASHRLFDGVGAVVLPALVEEQPRLLLHALACRVPVVATAACGLPAGSYVEIPYGDASALARSLVRLDVRPRAVAQLRAEITP